MDIIQVLIDLASQLHDDVVPFEPYLREIKALGIDGAISIELEYSPDPARIVEWVTEAYRETDKLLSAVGLRG